METTICRECGGNCKPSKGLMNYHNIQYPLDGSRAEFEVILEDCLKCEDCGHSFRPEKLREFQDLGMNINSDQFLLPDHYTAISQPHYKGDGNHSIKELQELCKNFTEYCHQQALIKQRLIKEIKTM